MNLFITTATANGFQYLSNKTDKRNRNVYNKTKFQNSTERFSFLYCIADIIIALINPGM